MMPYTLKPKDPFEFMDNPKTIEFIANNLTSKKVKEKH